MQEPKLPSLHDHLLISYEVTCERRQIELRARTPDWLSEPEISTILFDGVERYSFVDDAFGISFTN